MKRVLVFSLVYYPRVIGGAEVAVKEITDRIIPADISFDMVTLRKRAAPFEQMGNVNVYRVGIPWIKTKNQSSKIFPLAKLLYIGWAAYKAVKLHRENHYDAVWSIMASYAGFSTLLFKLCYPRVPLLLTIQEGDHFERREGIFRPFFRKIFEHADRVQVISGFLYKWAIHMGAKCAIETIPNGVDMALFSKSVSPEGARVLKERLKKKEGDIFLITTSRLVFKNAIDDVVVALSYLPARVKFLILGQGHEERLLRRKAHELNLENRVQFLGYVPHQEMPKYLHASDIFIRPSRSEGMGNSFIEAMAAGLPVIATQEGGIADFLFDAKRNPDREPTGWAVDKDSPEQIAEAVRDILSNPKQVSKVTAHAKRMVIERYDWDLVAQQMRERVFDPLFKTPL